MGTQHEPHHQALLDNFIETARYDLGFDDVELVEAVVQYHVRYQTHYPDDDEATAKWRNKVIAILRRAQKDIEALDGD